MKPYRWLKPGSWSGGVHDIDAKRHFWHARFVALREDKNARDVVREDAVVGENRRKGSRT